MFYIYSSGMEIWFLLHTYIAHTPPIQYKYAKYVVCIFNIQFTIYMFSFFYFSVCVLAKLTVRLCVFLLNKINVIMV